jgi:hypothetical protein
MALAKKDVRMGARVTVYWPAEDYWFHGAVIGTTKKSTFSIRYDAGGVDELDDTTSKWQVLSKDVLARDSAHRWRKRERIKALKVGSYVTVYWPHEDAYFQGTIIQLKSIDNPYDTESNPHCISYDDGDNEWTNLYFRKFFVIQQDTQQLEVGLRINLWDKGKTQKSPGSIIKIEKDRACPHQVKFDDQRKGNGWFNLYVESFQVISQKDNSPRKQPPAKPTPKRMSSKKVHETIDITPILVTDQLEKPPVTSVSFPKLVKKRKNRDNHTLKSVEVQEIVPPDSAPLPKVLKKRKLEFLQDMNESDIGQGWKQMRIKAKEEPCQ